MHHFDKGKAVILSMDAERLREEFARRGPWVTRFQIEGEEYGGSFDPALGGRVEDFFRVFPGVRSILELGCLEGGHTFALARQPSLARVLGLDARPQNIARARFVQDLLRSKNVEFAQADLEETNLTGFGEFDAVFCSGLLYHLWEPWKLVEQIPRVAPRLFIWTHYAPENEATLTRGNWRGREQVEGGKDEPLSGMKPKSFWLTLESLLQLLRSAGFTSIKILENNLEHSNGPAVRIAASLVGA